MTWTSLILSRIFVDILETIKKQSFKRLRLTFWSARKRDLLLEKSS
jgi:hypothetical protein